MIVKMSMDHGKVVSVEVTGAYDCEAQKLADFLMQKPVQASQESNCSETVLKEVVRIFSSLPDTKIPCIKAVRVMTGWGLKESKDFVDKHFTTQFNQY